MEKVSPIFRKSYKWFLRVIYFVLGLGMYHGALSGVYDGLMEIDYSSMNVYMICLTLSYLSFEIYNHSLKKGNEVMAEKAIKYEIYSSIFFIIFISFMCYSFVAYVPLTYAFNTAVTLQLSVVIGGIWFVQKHCSIVWDNGLFNSNSKIWDFDKMKYSICEHRFYNSTWPKDPNKKIWEPGAFVSWIIILSVCIFFALMIHKKDGHSGSLILTLLFRNSPVVGDLANGILVFFIGQIALWFMMIPSVVLKVMEIIKIRQIEKVKGVRMLVKEQKLLKKL